MMQHILVNCQESRIHHMVWNLASELWHKREPSWPEISFRSILGTNLPNCISMRNTKKQGQNRLFTILVLESAHLIWKLQCDWLIENQGDQSKSCLITKSTTSGSKPLICALNLISFKLIPRGMAAVRSKPI